MGVKDQIRDLDEYQAEVQRQQGQQAGQQAGQAAPAATGNGSGGTTEGNPLGPVTDWEKTDVEFWMQVAQVVLLYLILRKLQRGA